MIVTVLGNSYIRHNDELFLVKRTLNELHNPNVDAWKDLLDCDIVLRKEQKLYFCRKVVEAEVINDEQI